MFRTHLVFLSGSGCLYRFKMQCIVKRNLFLYIHCRFCSVNDKMIFKGIRQIFWIRLFLRDKFCHFRWFWSPPKATNRWFFLWKKRCGERNTWCFKVCPLCAFLFLTWRRCICLWSFDFFSLLQCFFAGIPLQCTDLSSFLMFPFHFLISFLSMSSKWS